MVGLINLGAGLAAMGTAIATSAGDAALMEQKSQLESKQAVLADQLATVRESAGRQEAGQIAEASQSRQIAAEQGLEASREQSAQTIVGKQTASAETIAQAQRESAEKIAGMDIGARSKDLATQIAATAKETQIDASTGSLVMVDRQTNKTTPILDSSGEPFKPVNPAMASVAVSTINSANEQLRAVYNARANDMREAQDAADKVSQRADLVGDDKTKAVAAAQAQVKSVADRYNGQITALQTQIATASQALLTKVGGPQGATQPKGMIDWSKYQAPGPTPTPGP